jgi:SynChlorMet cassette protein ScmC
MGSEESLFKLQLSDGQAWQIVGSKELAPWLNKFAALLGLSSNSLNGFPKIIFKQITSHSEKSDLIEKGWYYSNNHRTTFWSDPEIKEEDHSGITFWFHPQKKDIICDPGQKATEKIDFLKMWLALYPISLKAQSKGGVPFHAGLVKKDGKGFLLAAPGGMGKSTCCRRIPPPWETLCDDEVIITHVDNGSYHVHPFPTWSDYIYNRPSSSLYAVERNVPLSAIFFLYKSQEDEVAIISKEATSVFIFNSAFQACYRNWRCLDSEERIIFRKRLFTNACELAQRIPAYKLGVRLDGRFWEKMESVIIY